MKIRMSLVGYGRLARHLAPALLSAEIDIVQWYIRGAAARNEVDSTYDTEVVDSLEKIREAVDIILLMISDDAVIDVSNRLYQSASLITHTSGMIDVNQISHHRRGKFYPLNTFSGISQVWNMDTPLFIEANSAKDLMLLNSIASLLSRYVVPIDDTVPMSVVHTAAVISQNFSNHLIARAEELLLSHNLDRQLIQPLLKSMLQNLVHSPAALNQTGPAIRRDEKTIDRQLQLLHDEMPLNEIYHLISRDIQTHSFALLNEK